MGATIHKENHNPPQLPPKKIKDTGSTAKELPVQQNLRARDVQKILGISRSAMYMLIQQGKLPKPFHIGRSSLWVASEIQAVIDAQIAIRDEAVV